MSKTKLGIWDKRVLLKALLVRNINLFNRLENEIDDLSVFNYFDQYYKRLFRLVYDMERNYPPVDMSTNDIDLLYKRIHMND